MVINPLTKWDDPPNRRLKAPSPDRSSLSFWSICISLLEFFVRIWVVIPEIRWKFEILFTQTNISYLGGDFKYFFFTQIPGEKSNFNWVVQPKNLDMFGFNSFGVDGLAWCFLTGSLSLRSFTQAGRVDEELKSVSKKNRLWPALWEEEIQSSYTPWRIHGVFCIIIYHYIYIP